MIPSVPMPELDEQPPVSKTWQIDYEQKRFAGFVDGLDAVLQSAYLTLKTPKYQYLIYPWRHGSELHTLIGKDQDYALSEAKRMIRSALSADPRITAVKDFVVHDGVLFFTIETIYGAASMNTEVRSE